MSVLGGNPSMDYCKELRAELAELREALEAIVQTEYSLTSHLAALEKCQDIARNALKETT